MSKQVKYALTYYDLGPDPRFVRKVDSNGRLITNDVKQALLFDTAGQAVDVLAGTALDYYNTYRSRDVSRDNGLARVTITSGTKKRRIVDLGSGEKVTGFAIRGSINPVFYGNNGTAHSYMQDSSAATARLFATSAGATQYVSKELRNLAVELVGVIEEPAEDVYEVEYL